MGIRLGIRRRPAIDENSNDHTQNEQPEAPGPAGNDWRQPGRRSLDARVVPNLRTPDGVSSYASSYATMRLMARDVVENTHITPVEKGLALSLLAVIEDFESYYRAHEG